MGHSVYRNSVDHVNRISVFTLPMHDSMSIGDRLRQARLKAGYPSARAAAIAFGWKPSTYASHENGQTDVPPLEAMQRYAKAFRVPVETLLLASASKPAEPSITISVAPVRGIAQAGIWREHEEMDFAELDPVPVVPGKWISLEQFAFKVEGPSMNRAGVVEGSFVVCVPYFLARREWITEDMVVVERRRGQIVERTVKRLRLVPEGAELWPESDDPRYQAPVFIAPNGSLHEDDGTSVEIVGLVIGVYRPL